MLLHAFEPDEKKHYDCADVQPIHLVFDKEPNPMRLASLLSIPLAALTVWYSTAPRLLFERICSE